jgi:hypothetical protein
LRCKPQNFNDFLALILALAIITVWVTEAAGWIAIQGEVNGALIATFTLIIQYYYRRKPTES